MDKDEIIKSRKALGERLKGIREAKGLKKTPFAYNCGFIGTTPLDSIERGETSYTIDNFIKYLNALDIDIASLLGNDVK